MAGHILPVYGGAEPDDYARLGIEPGTIAPWEDGMRTDGSPGTYEWWYFDAHLDGGGKLVILFHTKIPTNVDRPLAPVVTFNYDRADGAKIEKAYEAPARLFSASREQCDVRIGANRFSGNLRDYSIHVEGDDVVADLTLHGIVPAWRPGTAHIFFGEHREHFFAWLPSVPQGQVEATLTVAGKSEHLSGIGYHDHNWGNISMVRLMHHWYWARATIGDYTVIASYITAGKAYGYIASPVFMLAHKGEIIADDARRVRFAAGDVHIDDLTRKPVANNLVFDYRDGRRFVLTLSRKKDIVRMRLADTLPGIRAVLARLSGFDGAYLRFTGDAQLDRYDGDQIVESLHEEAIWELMYFGHALTT